MVNSLAAASSREGKIVLVKKRILLTALGLGLLSTVAPAEENAHWTYKGEHGPEHWAKISKENGSCAGREQSPVNLTADYKGSPERLVIAWKRFLPEVENNGHTIEANAVPGSYTLFGGKRFDLLQVHFHHRSEHTIEGKHYPLEAHFVHKGGDGKLLVLGVMIDRGPAHLELGKIWAAAPRAKGRSRTTKPVRLDAFIPKQASVYRYAGSLTTPPCSEIVSWVVYSRPITASQAQIDTFAKLYPANNRPVQDLNRRFVLFGR